MPLWAIIIGGIVLVVLVALAWIGVSAMIGTARAFGRYL